MNKKVPTLWISAYKLRLAMNETRTGWNQTNQYFIAKVFKSKAAGVILL